MQLVPAASTFSLHNEALSELVGLVYESAVEEAQWRGLIDRLTALLPGTGGVLVHHDGTDFAVSYVGSQGGSPDGSSSEVWISRRRKSASASVCATPPGLIVSSARAWTEAAWSETSVHRERLAPNGFRHALLLSLGLEEGRGAFLGFAIPKDEVEHDRCHDPLLALLGLLAPHAVRAFAFARALGVARRATEIATDLLDRVVLPVLVTDTACRFRSGNAAGRLMLDRGAPFRLDEGSRLVLADAGDTDAFRRAIRRCDQGRLRDVVRVETSGGPLLLAVTPFRPTLAGAATTEGDMRNEDRLFAVFVNQTSPGSVDRRLLEDAFHLTPREAEICQHLLRGQSPAVIAAAAGRSKKTVRNQIQAIHDKVGVSSNAALMEALTLFRTVGAPQDLAEAGAPDARGGPPAFHPSRISPT